MDIALILHPPTPTFLTLTQSSEFIRAYITNPNHYPSPKPNHYPRSNPSSKLEPKPKPKPTLELNPDPNSNPSLRPLSPPRAYRPTQTFPLCALPPPSLPLPVARPLFPACTPTLTPAHTENSERPVQYSTLSRWAGRQRGRQPTSSSVYRAQVCPSPRLIHFPEGASAAHPPPSPRNDVSAWPRFAPRDASQRTHLWASLDSA